MEYINKSKYNEFSGNSIDRNYTISCTLSKFNSENIINNNNSVRNKEFRYYKNDNDKLFRMIIEKYNYKYQLFKKLIYSFLFNISLLSLFSLLTSITCSMNGMSKNDITNENTNEKKSNEYIKLQNQIYPQHISFNYKSYLLEMGNFDIITEYFISPSKKEEIINYYCLMNLEMKMLSYNLINIEINNKNQTQGNKYSKYKHNSNIGHNDDDINHNYQYFPYKELIYGYNQYDFLNNRMNFKDFGLLIESFDRVDQEITNNTIHKHSNQFNTTHAVNNISSVESDEQEISYFTYKRNKQSINYYISHEMFTIDLRNSYVLNTNTYAKVIIGFYSKYLFGFGERNHKFFLEPGVYHSWPRDQVRQSID